MPLSVRQSAKRAFVAVLLEVARLYAVPTAVNRDSLDAQVLAAYRKVILKAHPDKGGLQLFSRSPRARRRNGSARVQHLRVGRATTLRVPRRQCWLRTSPSTG